MAWEWLGLWWNAIYSVPLLVVLICLTLTAVLTLVTGGIGWFDGGAGALEAGDALDVPAGAEAGGAEHDAGDVGPGWVVAAFWFLGARTLPTGMLLQVFWLLWGITGISLHQAVAASHPGCLLWSVPVALLASALGTRSVAWVVGRFFPRDETYAVRRGDMVGCRGRVLYPVSLDAGTVQVRDQHGTLHQLRARAAHGTLDTGQEIIVLGYDPAQRIYQVDDATRFLERC